MWLEAPNIPCTHGFSTRHGGVSPAPFNSLNLGGSQDEPANVMENREIALGALHLPPENLCTLKQVHGTTVCVAERGVQEGDAIVTNKKDLILAVSIADCYPILFYDPLNKVIGAAHAGWRGTVGGIAAHTVKAMQSLGAQPDQIQVAIGQGISLKNFEVGEEVLQQFKDAGFPATTRSENKIDLIKSNIFVLTECGVPLANIWAMNRCTFEDDFFSYRQDKGVTGRMWALLTM